MSFEWTETVFEAVQDTKLVVSLVFFMYFLMYSYTFSRELANLLGNINIQKLF